MKEKKSAVSKPREPPKYMRYTIWFTGGKDGLAAFDELFEDGVQQFGYRAAWLWGAKQCLKSVPYKLWGIILKLCGFW